MNNQILIEPLRERVILVGKDCLTYADSRALLVFSDKLPYHPNQKAKPINPQMYYVLGYGEMVPVEDCYDTVTTFTASEFRENTMIRELVLMMLHTYIAKNFDLGDDLDILVTEAEDAMKNVGFYDFADYESDIIRIFKSMAKSYKRT